MDKTFRILLILFIAAAIVLLGVVGVSLRNIQRAQLSAEWVNHTHALITEVNDTIAAIRSADGALSTYLLTNDAGRQTAFREAFAELAEHVEVAKALAATDEANAAAIAELEALLQTRADFARTILSAHRSGDTQAVQDQLTADTADGGLYAIVAAGQRIRAELIEQLSARDREAYRTDQTARTTLYLGAALNIVLLLGAAWFIRDDLAARRTAAELLQADNERLEARVAERTVELREANTKLKAENLESRWKNQALGHQLRYNHLIIDSISELVLVITKARNISRVNPAVTNATGFDLPSLADRPLDEIVQLDAPEEGSPPLVEPIAHALRTGQDLRDRPARLVTLKGDTLTVRFSIYPLRDSDKVVGGVVTLHLTSPASHA